MVDEERMIRMDCDELLPLDTGPKLCKLHNVSYTHRCAACGHIGPVASDTFPPELIEFLQIAEKSFDIVSVEILPKKTRRKK